MKSDRHLAPLELFCVTVLALAMFGFCFWLVFSIGTGNLPRAADAGIVQGSAFVDAEPADIDAGVAHGDADVIEADAAAPRDPSPTSEAPPTGDATPEPPDLRPTMSAGFIVVGITKTRWEADEIARSFRQETKVHDDGRQRAERWSNLTNVLRLFDAPPRRPDWLWAVRVSGLKRPEAARLCLWLLRSGGGWSAKPNRVCAYSADPWFTNKTPLVDPTSNHEGGL